MSEEEFDFNKLRDTANEGLKERIYNDLKKCITDNSKKGQLWGNVSLAYFNYENSNYNEKYVEYIHQLIKQVMDEHKELKICGSLQKVYTGAVSNYIFVFHWF